MDDTDQAFVAAVEAIYCAATEPNKWPDALQAIAAVFGDTGCVMSYGRDDGTYGVVTTTSFAEAAAEYMAAWGGRDIRAIRASQRGYFFKRDVITDNDLVSDDEMNSDPFYADFLRRYGLRYFAGVTVSPDPHLEVAVSVQRRDHLPKYSEDELATLRRLGPHIERALRIGLRLMDAELTGVEMGDALTRIGIGVFALDALGRVAFSNAAAQRLIGDGLELEAGRLQIATLSQAGAASGRIGFELPTIHSMPGRPVLVQRRRSEGTVAIHVLPVVPSAEAGDFLTQVRALVLAVDLQPGAPPEPALVRDLLGLTLGEARVASLVGGGMSPRDAATRLSITEDTARTVLKRVFSKVGVSRQSELAAMMARLTLR